MSPIECLYYISKTTGKKPSWCDLPPLHICSRSNRVMTNNPGYICCFSVSLVMTIESVGHSKKYRIKKCIRHCISTYNQVFKPTFHFIYCFVFVSNHSFLKRTLSCLLGRFILTRGNNLPSFYLCCLLRRVCSKVTHTLTPWLLGGGFSCRNCCLSLISSLTHWKRVLEDTWASFEGSFFSQGRCLRPVSIYSFIYYKCILL